MAMADRMAEDGYLEAGYEYIDVRLLRVNLAVLRIVSWLLRRVMHAH